MPNEVNSGGSGDQPIEQQPPPVVPERTDVQATPPVASPEVVIPTNPVDQSSGNQGSDDSQREQQEPKKLAGDALGNATANANGESRQDGNGTASPQPEQTPVQPRPGDAPQPSEQRLTLSSDTVGYQIRDQQGQLVDATANGYFIVAPAGQDFRQINPTGNTTRVPENGNLQSYNNIAPGDIANAIATASNGGNVYFVAGRDGDNIYQLDAQGNLTPVNNAPFQIQNGALHRNSPPPEPFEQVVPPQQPPPLDASQGQPFPPQQDASQGQPPSQQDASQGQPPSQQDASRTSSDASESSEQKLTLTLSTDANGTSHYQIRDGNGRTSDTGDTGYFVMHLTGPKAPPGTFIEISPTGGRIPIDRTTGILNPNALALSSENISNAIRFAHEYDRGGELYFVGGRNGENIYRFDTEGNLTRVDNPPFQVHDGALVRQPNSTGPANAEAVKKPVEPAAATPPNPPQDASEVKEPALTIDAQGRGRYISENGDVTELDEVAQVVLMDKNGDWYRLSREKEGEYRPLAADEGLNALDQNGPYGIKDKARQVVLPGDGELVFCINSDGRIWQLSHEGTLTSVAALDSNNQWQNSSGSAFTNISAAGAGAGRAWPFNVQNVQTNHNQIIRQITYNPAAAAAAHEKEPVPHQNLKGPENPTGSRATVIGHPGMPQNPIAGIWRRLTRGPGPDANIAPDEDGNQAIIPGEALQKITGPSRTEAVTGTTQGDPRQLPDRMTSGSINNERRFELAIAAPLFVAQDERAVRNFEAVTASTEKLKTRIDKFLEAYAEARKTLKEETDMYSRLLDASPRPLLGSTETKSGDHNLSPLTMVEVRSIDANGNVTTREVPFLDYQLSQLETYAYNLQNALARVPTGNGRHNESVRNVANEYVPEMQATMKTTVEQIRALRAQVIGMKKGYEDYQRDRLDPTKIHVVSDGKTNHNCVTATINGERFEVDVSDSKLVGYSAGQAGRIEEALKERAGTLVRDFLIHEDTKQNIIGQRMAGLESTLASRKLDAEQAEKYIEMEHRFMEYRRELIDFMDKLIQLEIRREEAEEHAEEVSILGTIKIGEAFASLRTGL